MRQWTGIPTCVGIGPTKTLAKLANHIAKETPRLKGICDLTSEASRKLASLTLTKNPNASILSVLLTAGMPLESVRANIKLAISGGQNEPRDAIAGTIWALLTHPQQLAVVRSGQAKWLDVFEEYARWMAPIGMSPRRVAKPWSFCGVDFEPEDRVFFMFGSANRDEAHFSDARLLRRDARYLQKHRVRRGAALLRRRLGFAGDGRRRGPAQHLRALARPTA